MAVIQVPTSRDIYIEVNGLRIAAAQSYKMKTVRESRYIEAFGSSEPVGATGGRIKHALELSRVLICDAAFTDRVDFYALSGFNVVIVKPDRKIIFTGCEWSGISENASLGEAVIEAVNVVASRRIEVGARA